MARKLLKIIGGVVGIVAGLFVLLIAYAVLRWDAPVDRPVQEMVAPRDSATVARGAFLFQRSLTCWECHTATADEHSPASGGLRFDLTRLSPSLGVYYSANITPDVETGIGGWTDGEIVRAIREGVRKDGTFLFPIMPVDAIHGLSDQDALALVAFLRTQPAVKNAVPHKEPSLFAKVLMSLGVVGPAPAITAPVAAPDRAVTAAYGEYVVRHASLCAECHTPRSLKTGEFYHDSLLAGSSIRFGEDEKSPVLAFASNLTSDPETGIGNWNEEQFLRMVTSGTGPDGKVRVRHMPYAYYGLWDSLELRAVYQYVKGVPPIRRKVPEKVFEGDLASTDPETRGHGYFVSICAGCHGKEGTGASPTSVVLAEVAPSLSDEDLREFIGTGEPDLRMPSFEKTISNDDLDGIVKYIRTWKSSAPPGP